VSETIHGQVDGDGHVVEARNTFSTPTNKEETQGRAKWTGGGVDP